jgi:RNA polymerase sigma factor (sigma-70 family)
MHEEQLINKCLNGEQAAYYDLVRYLQPVAARIVHSRLPAEADRQDAIQETLVRACLHLNCFRGKSLKAWVAAIARNYCCEYYRRRHDTITYVDELPDLPDNSMLRAAHANWELSALQQLAGDDWAVLKAYAEHGPKVAEALGIPHKTIRVRICRIRTRLRNGR